jgi:hypothetical protein
MELECSKAEESGEWKGGSWTGLVVKYLKRN